MKVVSLVIFWIIAVMLAMSPGYAIFDDEYLSIVVISSAISYIIWKIGLGISTKKYVVVSLLMIILTSIVGLSFVFNDIELDRPTNPFGYLDGGEGTGSYRARIYDWQYWFPDKVRKQFLERVPRDRIIKFSQNDQYLRIRGVEKNIIVQAFGEPTKKYIQGEFEIWEYHPWPDHPDWVMPVYLKDQKLWSVGSPNE